LDRITSEMLKTDGKLSADILLHLPNEIWEKERIPSEWKTRIIIKLPKKGSLTECGNWRGITLLSVPRKILCRIILDRMKDAI